MKYFRGMIILFLFNLVLSCDAPRLNPFDPQNPDYPLASIDGFVKKATGAHQPISGVKVIWKNQNIVVDTDANGYFKIDQVLLQNGMITFEKDGYSTKDSLISFENQKTQHLEILLNAIPQLDKLNFYTSVQNRYPDDQKDSLFVKAKISDAENDVDSVFILCTELNVSKKLVFNTSSQSYENKFSPGDLNLKFMDQGIGKDFEIMVKEHSKELLKIGSSFTLKRIIRQYISFVSPANSQIVEQKPKFIWKRFLPGFNFTYTFEIYTNEISPRLVLPKENISKDEIELTLTADLPPGEYFWIIWCVDDFQNRSSSLPASFVVQ